MGKFKGLALKTHSLVTLIDYIKDDVGLLHWRPKKEIIRDIIIARLMDVKLLIYNYYVLILYRLFIDSLCSTNNNNDHNRSFEKNTRKER